MLAATCPHCHHAIFADDEAALTTLNCPACQQVVGALVPDVASAPITELPEINTDEPDEAAEPHDQGLITSVPEVASDNPYAAPIATDGATGQRVAKPVQKRELADLFERFIGALIDYFVYFVVAIFGYYTWIPLAWVTPDLPRVVLPLTLAAGAVLLVAMSQWILISLTAQSFGKRVMGTYIVRHSTGERVGFVRGVLLRSWVFVAVMYFVPPQLLFLDYAVILLPMRRCLHDLLAGTDVVRYRKLQSWERK